MERSDRYDYISYISIYMFSDNGGYSDSGRYTICGCGYHIRRHNNRFCSYNNYIQIDFPNKT